MKYLLNHLKNMTGASQLIGQQQSLFLLSNFERRGKKKKNHNPFCFFSSGLLLGEMSICRKQHREPYPARTLFLPLSTQSPFLHLPLGFRKRWLNFSKRVSPQLFLDNIYPVQSMAPAGGKNALVVKTDEHRGIWEFMNPYCCLEQTHSHITPAHFGY